MTIEPTELTELTPEQKLAVEQRKERLKVNREIEERERAARGRRRVMDPDATLKMLVQKKLVTTTWANRISKRKDARKWIGTACIAKQVDAISLTGVLLNLNPVTGFRGI